MGRAARQRRGIESRATRWPRPPVIGIDIGGVLVDRASEGSDTSFFGADPMATPAVRGSHEAVRTVVGLFGRNHVHVVSKAGPKISELSRRWLHEQRLLDRGAISPSNVHFVRKRVDKHSVCRRLGITHFVDDRADVLQHLVTVDYRYLFSGGLGSNDPATQIPEGVSIVATWQRLVGLIERDLLPTD